MEKMTNRRYFWSFFFYFLAFDMPIVQYLGKSWSLASLQTMINPLTSANCWFESSKDIVLLPFCPWTKIIGWHEQVLSLTFKNNFWTVLFQWANVSRKSKSWGWPVQPLVEKYYICSSALSLQQFCSTNGPRKDCFVCLCEYNTLYLSYHNEVTLQK